MATLENHILVIFGGSGDLTQKKLIPALCEMYHKKMLPETFAVLGVGRTNFNHETYREHLYTGLNKQQKLKIQLFCNFYTKNLLLKNSAKISEICGKIHFVFQAFYFELLAFRNPNSKKLSSHYSLN